MYACARVRVCACMRPRMREVCIKKWLEWLGMVKKHSKSMILMKKNPNHFEKKVVRTNQNSVRNWLGMLFSAVLKHFFQVKNQHSYRFAVQPAQLTCPHSAVRLRVATLQPPALLALPP